MPRSRLSRDSLRRSNHQQSYDGVIAQYINRAFNLGVNFGAQAQVDTENFAKNLGSGNWDRQITGATANTTAPQISGGVVEAYTGVNANNIAEILRGAAVGSPAFFGCFFSTTDPFYLAVRMQIPSTIDAAAQCVSAVRGSSTGALSAKMGAIGSVSTANFSALVDAAAPSTIISGIAFDNLYHTHEMLFDGTQFHYAVDGENFQSVVNAPDEPGTFSFSARNGATAANRSIRLNWMVAVATGQ